jgi:hypothetical protein
MVYLANMTDDGVYEIGVDAVVDVAAQRGVCRENG